MKFSSFVGFVVIVFIHPLTALLTAAAYGYLWTLTLAAQYGAGPSYQSWYGISTIVSLLVMGTRKSGTEKDESPIATAIFTQVLFLIVIGFSILLALLTRAMLGWQ